MAPEPLSKKRRASATEKVVEDSEDDALDSMLEGVLSDDESEFGSNDGDDLQDEDESSEGSQKDESDGFDDEDAEVNEEDDDALHSDGAGSDLDQDEILNKLLSKYDEPEAVQNGDKVDNTKVPTEEDDEDKPNYRVETDANGGVRYVYQEIDPVYDSDDSDAKEPINTIGDIPLSFYDSYPHIGYDISGKKIMRPAAGEALDALLDSIEIPKGFTGLTDPATGKPLRLSQDELELLRKIQQNEIPEEGYDPYPDTVEYFTSIVEEMPLSAAPEPKRRFLPSKMEAQRIWKMVKAIREGRIMPYKPPEEREREEAEKDDVHYDVWANEVPREAHVMHIAAPKEPPPGYDMSYNPPPEYLPSKTEKEAWEKQDPEEREKEYLPQKFDALRKVPGYGMLVKERFERCLDLYLAPRVKKNRLNIDPASLLPKLPRAEDLRPFPTVCQTVFRGHQGWVRSVAIDPNGSFVASGGSDGTVRIWDLLTGRQLWKARISSDEVVQSVRWRPTKDAFVLAAAAGEEVFFMVPPVIDPEFEQVSRDVLDAGFGYQANSAQQTADGKPVAAKWTRPGPSLENEGVLLKVTVRSLIKTFSWHRGGKYLCSISPAGGRSAVAIHTLAQHRTQMPFRRSNMSQSAQFHPERPHLFLASKQSIKVWDLQKMELVKKVEPGAKIISGFDLHPSGNHMIVGAYDRRLLWHDLDLSNRPYKVMRFHDKAVRAVAYHKGGHPLAADASDDGSLQVFHSKVVNDLMENATIIPLKKLQGHKVVESVGVLDIDFHPREPWIVSAGADGTIRLWM